MVFVYIIFFIVTVFISILWVKGIDKNKDLDKDNCGWLE
jgi:hypothetical protein